MLRERAFDTGELIINYGEGQAAGPPLVLLHGTTMRWQRFDQFITTLQQQWHVYSCDLRGHGQSRWTRSGYRLTDYLRDTTAFVEGGVGEPAVLIGFSMGALISIGVAAQCPQLIRAIVLLEPPLMYRECSIQEMGWVYEYFTWVKETLDRCRTLAEVVARCREYDPTLSERDVQDQAARIHCLDPQMLAYLLDNRWYEGFDLEQLLPKVTCPALLVRGVPDLGSTMREIDAAFFKVHMSHATMIQIEGVGHGVVRDAPGQLALAHVTEFLNSL